MTFFTWIFGFTAKHGEGDASLNVLVTVNGRGYAGKDL